MNFDANTKAREEREDEEMERREQLEDLLAAVRCLLLNGKGLLQFS